MNGTARADRSIRRLAGVPEPYGDESFGSWLARLAVAHHVGRDDFVQALLREPQTRRWHDYDIAPSPALIAELCRRTGWDQVRFERLILRAEEQVPSSKTRALESYCPTCWVQDRKNGTRYIRRLWRERWGVMCELHRIPLCESRLPAEELLCGTSDEDPQWREKDPKGCFPQALSVEVTRAQAQVRAFEAHDARSTESAERAQVLRDLALMAGTRFPGDSLVEWSLRRQGIGRCRLYWHDGRDPASTEAASANPCGTLKVRRHALRIATLLVLQTEGVRMMKRQEDISIWAMLTVVNASTEFAWALNALRRSWSTAYRDRWSATFLWSDRRDLVVWARSEEVSRLCEDRARALAESAAATRSVPRISARA